MAARPVVLVDIDVPFMSLVKLFVKTAIALVPAAIIVAVFWVLIAGLMGGVFSRLTGGA
jgi:hypothetical protein